MSDQTRDREAFEQWALGWFYKGRTGPVPKNGADYLDEDVGWAYEAADAEGDDHAGAAVRRVRPGDEA